MVGRGGRRELVPSEMLGNQGHLSQTGVLIGSDGTACAFGVRVSEGKDSSVWAALTKYHRLGLNKTSIFSQF